MSTGAAGRDVAVLGGGFMGLGAARRLARAGRRVTLYEAAPRAGGVSAASELGGRLVDRFYHTILPGDTELLRLIAELGLADRVGWRTTRTGFYRDGLHHSVSDLREFLRFPVLTPAERLRLGCTLLMAQRVVSWRSIRHLTCEQWLTRSCGRGVYEKLWRPLLRAKLGEAAPRVSASFIWATMNRLQDAKRGEGTARRDRMGFLQGSYAVVLDALADDLASRGAIVVTGSPVRRLTPTLTGGWRVETAAGAAEHAAVLATIPPAALARALGSAPGAVPGDVLARLAGVEYLGVVVEALLLSRPLGPFYVLNLGEDGLPFTGVIETTNLAPEGYFGGRSLVYLPRYLAPGDPWAGRDDGEVASEFHHHLARVFPDFSERMIVASVVQRAPVVQPIHTVDYPERIPPERLAPGLWFASSSQVHPWPLNNDRVLRQAHRVADAVLSEAALGASAGVATEGSTAAAATPEVTA